MARSIRLQGGEGRRQVLGQYEARREPGGRGFPDPVQRLHDGKQERCDNGVEAG